MNHSVTSLETSSTNTRLRADLDNASMWKIVHDPVGVAYYPVIRVDGWPVDDRTHPGYRNADLEQVHAHLPAIMDALFQPGFAMGDSVSGHIVRANAQFLGNMLVPISGAMFGIGGSGILTLRDSFSLAVLGNVNAANPALQARFFAFDRGVLPNGLAYIERCNQHHFLLTHHWLENHRPDFRKTLLLAEMMEVSGEELAQMIIFNDHPAHHPEQLAQRVAALDSLDVDLE